MTISTQLFVSSFLRRIQTYLTGTYAIVKSRTLIIIIPDV